MLFLIMMFWSAPTKWD